MSRHPFTVKDIEGAVKALEANNIPPAICTKCGNGFYLLIPGRALFGADSVSAGFCCDECKAAIMKQHGG